MKLIEKYDIKQVACDNTLNFEWCNPNFQHLVDYRGEEKLFPFSITDYNIYVLLKN